MDRTDETIDMAKQKIERHMRELFDIKDGHNMFIVVTEAEEPYPLARQEEYEASDQTPNPMGLLKRLPLIFVNKLKNAGLTTAYFAGMNFGGGPDFGDVYLDADQNPTNGLFENAKWKLKNYYQNRKPVGSTAPPHTFEKISPEGCLAGAIRMFAHENVDKIAITNATFPEKIPVINQIKQNQLGWFEIQKR